MEKVDLKNKNNDENKESLKEFCLNCHFLSKYFLVDIKQKNLEFQKFKDVENFEYVIPATNFDREQAKKKNFDWQINNLENKEYKLRCYFRVWDESVEQMDIDKKFENICDVERKDICYFWKYDTKSGFSNVERIELENVKEYKQKWYRFFFNFGMIFSIIVLIVDIVYMMYISR